MMHRNDNTAVQPNTAAPVTRIGRRYDIHQQLGAGGMGAVFRATDRLTGQTVALKQVKTSTTVAAESETLSDASMSVRLALAQEFKVLASLRHPHIITVTDYGFDAERQPYVVMELIANARTFLEAGRGKSVQDKVLLLIQLLQAIAYLHRRDILHRDLKPGNVLVTPGGDVKVLDFGLAVEPAEAIGLAGTIAYMAPEIITDGTASRASDLYAVGVMAYELFLGYHPFEKGDYRQMIAAALNEKPDLAPLDHLERKTIPQPTQPSPSATRSADTGADTDMPTVNYRHTGAAPTDDPTFIEGTLADLDVSLDDMTIAPDTPPGTNEPIDPLRTIHVDQGTTVEDDATEQHVTLPPDVNRRLQIGFDDIDLLTPTEDATLATIIGRLLHKLPDYRYWDAYRVIEDLCAAVEMEVPAESTAIRESFLQAATFVGRERELQQLERGLHGALTGHGSTWLVGGESGVGKSRLLDELRTRALVQGVTVLRGQGVAGGGLPFQLWRDPLQRILLSAEVSDLDAAILRDVVPDIEQLTGQTVNNVPQLTGQAYKERLFGVVTSLFEGHQRPVLLLLEDLQWMDESLELLDLLNGMAWRLPLLIVGTYRSEERTDMPERLSDMTHIKLDRLSDNAIIRLSTSMLGEAGQRPDVLRLLQRETEGNAYFLVEVVRALAEDAGRLDRIGSTALPEYVVAGGIQNIIQRRLERVPETMQPLLDVAAVAGRELDLTLLETLRGDIDIDEWLTICSNSAVLEVQDGVWRFAHDKLRRAALDSLTEPERVTINREVALAIERLYRGDDAQAATLMFHWGAAGDRDREFAYAVRAGRYALRISSLAEAERHFSRALEIVDRTDRLTYADLLINLGDAQQHLGEYGKATQNLQSGIALYREMNDASNTARALNLLGEIEWRQGNYEAATSYSEDSLVLSRELQNQPALARALNRLGSVALDQGDFSTATESFEASLAIAERAEDVEAFSTAINSLGNVSFMQGDYQRATEYYQKTLEIGEETGERRRVAIAQMNLGAVAGTEGDLEAATHYFEESLRLYRAIGERRGVSQVLDNLGVLSEMQGDYAQALNYSQQSLELAQAINNKPGIAKNLMNLGNASLGLDDVEQARWYFVQAFAQAYEIDAVPMLLETLGSLAKIHTDRVEALTWVNFVLLHPSLTDVARKMVEEVADELKQVVSDQVAKACAYAASTLEIEQIVRSILDDGANV